jgi:limonene-1,2-epoxide hydrolase
VKPSGEEALVRHFFERWSPSFDEMCAAFQDTFAEDCYWDQRPLAATTGIPQALRFLRRARTVMSLERVDVELIRIASASGAVHTQRIDRLYSRRGSLLVAAPVAGVLEIRDGKIVEWKEYFDSGLFVADTVRRGVSGLLSGLRPGSRR